MINSEQQSTLNQIESYLNGLPDRGQREMRHLHKHILRILPDCRLWFLDGKDEKGKVVSNPNIGYGQQTMKYAGGKTREFYQIGISANTTGISVYIMGIPDKKHLARTYGATIGKAGITGYCIKFRTLDDIRLDVLETAIKDGIEQTK